MYGNLMETGIVKWYNDAKRYGFIVADSDQSLIIVEKDNIQHDLKVVYEMQTVEFLREEDSVYGLIAKNVRVTGKSLNDPTDFLNNLNTNVNVVTYLDHPSIVVFENVLSTDICNEIISKHRHDKMNPNSGTESRRESFAQVTELVEQRGISLGMSPHHYDIIASTIVKYAEIPFNHIEACDIYNYETGQFLDLHHDYPYDPSQINYYKHGGDRVGSGVFYLNDDFTGGVTHFPKLGISIKPKAGSFLYFKQCYDEETNWSTIHESTIIIEGTKWVSACFFSDQPRVGYNPRTEIEK
jgi:prolyl 4-hydroxylase